MLFAVFHDFRYFLRDFRYFPLIFTFSTDLSKIVDFSQVLEYSSPRQLVNQSRFLVCQTKQLDLFQ